MYTNRSTFRFKACMLQTTIASTHGSSAPCENHSAKISSGYFPCRKFV